MSEKDVDAFMLAAIARAHKSLGEGGIHIDSALARAGELIAVGHNKRVQESTQKKGSALEFRSCRT